MTARFATTRPDTPLRRLARIVAAHLDLSDHVEEPTLARTMRVLARGECDARGEQEPPRTPDEIVAAWCRWIDLASV